jgi:hypothetical protein
MAKRKSMSATAPKGVDAYFPETSKVETQNLSATANNSVPETGLEEPIKTTVYITAEQRDYIDSLRHKLRNKIPGLTRSAVIRLALDALAQTDQELVVTDLLRHPEGTIAR